MVSKTEKKSDFSNHYEILNKINFPEDIKKLRYNELKILADEIRKFLIHTISKTGGHLSSNLGVVELTIAIHRVFNSPCDKIIWDVGHQSYVHKILTGRKNEFNNLRKYNGLAGFTKRSESEHDIFGAGHSGTSISAAVGIAAANALLQKEDYTVAIIGDGSFTGGLVYEAMNNSADKKNLIVILNDNEMSISKNVGAIANYFLNLRTNKRYFQIKHRAERILNYIPVLNRPIIWCIKKLKQTLRRSLYHSTFFEHLGFDFLGPVDGHDIKKMEVLLEEAKKRKKPVFIYVKTQKGKGYKKAENHAVEYHNVGSFDIDEGFKQNTETDTFSSVFGKEIIKIAEKNEKVISITAAMAEGTGLHKFREKFKSRFFDVGIAESHAAIFAGAFAVMGFVPVFACYSSFLQRSYDQIVHDIALQNLHVVFCIDRAGVVGDDGPTHHGVFDVSFLNHIPNLTIFSPSVYEELRESFHFAVNKMNSPVCIRYPRGIENKYLAEKIDKLRNRNNKEEFFFSDLLSTGEADAELIIITYGRIAAVGFELAEMINKTEKNDNNLKKAKIIKLNKIKPLNMSETEKIKSEICPSVKKIIFIEESMRKGGISEFLSVKIKEEIRYKDTEIKIFAIDDEFVPQGNVSLLFDNLNFNAEKIYKSITES